MSDRSWSPDDASSIRRLRLLLVAVLLVTMPAIALVGVYAVVTATQTVAFGELSTVDLVELYLLELGVFAAFAFLLYRITLVGVGRVNADAADAADADPDDEVAGEPTGRDDDAGTARSPFDPPGAG